MPTTDTKNYHFYFSMIDIKKIDPFPYQHRKYFDEGSLRELGASILRDGLIEPIIVRPQKKGRYQLIAGERRFRAIKDYTDNSVIQAKIVEVDDLQARRISATENLLRKDLSAIESIKATIKIIDVEMGKEPEYLTVGKTPLERVHKLLSKLDSIRRSRERGSVVLAAEKDLSNKYVGQVGAIFKNLPKPLKWQSFPMHDLTLLTDIPSDENPENAILLWDYMNLLENCGWKITHLINCPLSSERFTGNMVSHMQKKRILGIIRRTLIIGKLSSLCPSG